MISDKELRGLIRANTYKQFGISHERNETFLVLPKKNGERTIHKLDIDTKEGIDYARNYLKRVRDSIQKEVSDKKKERRLSEKVLSKGLWNKWFGTKSNTTIG